MAVQLLNLAVVHIIVSWGGSLYVRSEVSSVGKDELLNNLKGGFFIISEEKGLVRFFNENARCFGVRLDEGFRYRLTSDEE